MSMPDYNKTVTVAKQCKKSVEKEYKLGVSTGWAYYFAKQIIKPKTSVKQIPITAPNKPSGDYISRQIFKSSYLDMAERVVKYVEKNGQVPNNVKFTTQAGKTYKIHIRDVIYMFSRIIVYYDTNKAYPKYANVTSKSFTKPTETGNNVFDYFVKKTGFKPTCIDDVCEYIMKHYNYEFYFDDQKSNKQVIDSKAGNCTDLLQFLVNIAEALGYEWKVIHTQCRQSGTGHVYGKFKKKNSNTWFTRDVACIADESRYCVWCDVDNGGGYQLAVNPSWFVQNIHR